MYFFLLSLFPHQHKCVASKPSCSHSITTLQLYYYISTSLTQRLDPGPVCPRHLQFLAGSRAWGGDRRAVVAGECGRLPVELQQQIVGSRKVSVPASCLPGPGGGAPEDGVHWVNSHYSQCAVPTKQHFLSATKFLYDNE